MRPLNLAIAGFTCFRDRVEVGFRDMDIFAITGPTGAGKSTIVDAICYALYGRVPRHGETSSLISHDRDSMSVDLEFEAGGQRYRVHRGININRRTNRAGQEVVNRVPAPVQLEQMAEGEWRPIAGRVASVDEEIEGIVGLDYKSFTVCVLLPQGRFQEFLAGEKKDRREVLKELLDTGIYEQMMSIANARAKDLATRAEEMTKRLREDYADATPEALADVRGEIEATRGRLNAAEERREGLAAGLALSDSVVTSRRRQIERSESREKLLLRIGETEEMGLNGAQRLEGLRAEMAAAQKELSDIAYDRDLHSRLERATDKLHELAALKKDLGAAAAKAADAGAVKGAREAVAQAQSTIEKAETARGLADGALNAARRLDAAAHVRSGLKPGDACPVCGGVISSTAAAIEPHIAEAEEALQRALREERVAREDLAAAQTKYSRAAAAAEAATADSQRLAKAVEAASAQAASLVPEGVEASEAAVVAALGQQKALADRHRVVFDHEASLRRQVDELAPRVASSQAELANLQGQAGALETEVRQASEEAEASKAELIEIAGKIGLAEVLDLIERKQQPNQLLKELLADAQGEERTLTGRLATLENDELRIENSIERAAALREEVSGLTGRRDLFQELGRLLGAANFQTFVMEEAMQALAETATHHLTEIHPRFALVVGDGEFKVVDHWQADQVRSASTLSGGETFVASLALALALSERVPELRSAAATSLDSLFLDEGFGSLDQESLTEVIDALESLRSEERLVGIITHVPELARRIECRIEVEKSPQGSRVRVAGV